MSAVKQLTLLPEIDRPATEERVKEALDLARMFIQMGFHPGIEASTTAGYSLVPPPQTNAFHSSTESTAIKNVDIERGRKEHVERVIGAVQRLSKRQRELIMFRWFSDEDWTDVETYTEFNLSPATYYRHRADTFYKLAFALRLHVYVEDAESDRLLIGK